jgi:hypothetical protein
VAATKTSPTRPPGAREETTELLGQPCTGWSRRRSKPPEKEGPLLRGGVASRRVGRPEKEELCRQGGPVRGRWRAATGTSGSPNPEPTGFLK